MNNPNVDVIIYNIRKPQSACESAYSAPGSACSERPSKGCLTDSVSPRIKPTFGLDIQGIQPLKGIKDGNMHFVKLG